MRKLVFIASLALAACGQVDVDGAPEGEFTGTAVVVWVGEGNTQSGDGAFIFVPLRDNELTFTRDEKANVSEGNKVIQPGAFYTDGGSIPRVVQSIQGYNAWAFGPAYIIHDWLFVVRKCINDDEEWAENSPIANMSFRESAEIMAETIKTVTMQYGLQRKTGEAVNIIAPVTAGPISYNLWTEKNACSLPENDPLIQKVVAQVNREAAAGILSRASDFDFDVQSADQTDGLLRPIVVAEFGLPRKPRLPEPAR
ncbi:MAG: DUF1353 domain-containing protein [Pseudomonadota bacterium]